MNKLIICIRNSFLILPEWNASPVVSYSILATFLKKLENCGYSVSNNLLSALVVMPENSFLDFAKDIIEIVEEASGMSYNWKPFYPNFPQEVMDMSESELFINAIIHNWTLARPSKDSKIEPSPLVGNIQELKVLELGSNEQLEELFKLMMKSKSSLTSLQKEELEWFLTNYDSGSVLEVLTLPEKFEHQEVMAFVISQLIKNKILTIDNPIATRNYNSATSVLRVIVGLSDGDISLAKNVKFLPITKKLTQSICAALEAIENLEIDMLRHVNKWKLLFKLMRAKQFSTKKYPKLCKAVNVVRGHENVKTFNSLTESYFVQKDQRSLLSHLKTRPSLFARSLDRVINNFEDTENILYSFKTIAYQCSSLVLFQLISFYRSRSANPKRIFMPKGDKAKGYAVDNKLPQLATTTVEQIIDICFDGLEDKYSYLSELRSVYIDPILKDYTLPLQLRSASPSLKTVGRGTRFDIDKTFIRLFMNWVNLEVDGEEVRTDLDLSAYMLNENFEEVETIAYYQLTNDEIKCFHSGDIVNAPAPEGACEFIDIDVKSAVDCGVRYVAMCVHNFTNQSFVNFETAFAGWMTRDNIHSGESFEARTVNHRYDLTADSNYSLPVVFDLVEGKAIWLDLSLSSHPSFPNNVQSNRMTTNLILQAIVNRQFPTMYDLLQAHAKARGNQVYSKDEADTVFDLTSESILLPWELEKILGEYL
jgi:stress response protein SCP2